MLGSKKLNRDDLDFCKRQGAAHLLRKSAPQPTSETLEQKVDRLHALVCDPRETLPNRLAKRGARPIASNAAVLCKDVSVDEDAEMRQQARRAEALAELRAKLTYRDALGNTHEPGTASYEPGQIDHPTLFDLARELHNALIAGAEGEDGFAAVLDRWISARMGYQEPAAAKTVADDPMTLRKRLATRGEGRGALGVSNAAGLLR
jgi:hypothetical protein